MSLFVVSDNLANALPNPELLGVKAFAKIIHRDRGSKRDSQGRNKFKAATELAYVYHMCDPASPYFQYEEELRREKVIEDFLPKGWEPDAYIQEAIEKYRELKLTPSARLLESAVIGLHKLREFFEEVDLMAINDK